MPSMREATPPLSQGIASPDHRFVSPGEAVSKIRGCTGAGRMGNTWAYKRLLDLTGIEPMTTRVADVATEVNSVM